MTVWQRDYLMYRNGPIREPPESSIPVGQEANDDLRIKAVMAVRA